MTILLLNKDLRIENNPALQAVAKCNQPIYVFYFLQSKHIAKKAIASINYLKHRLHLLSQKIIINIFEVNDEIKFLQAIHHDKPIESIYINDCFTPFGIKRKENLDRFCKANKIEFISKFDYLNFLPGQITTANGTISKTFAPFYGAFLNQIDTLKLEKKISLPATKAFNHNLKIKTLAFRTVTNFPITRDQTLAAIERQMNYSERRDQLADLYFPSRIAAALGWGVISFVEATLFTKNRFGLESEFLRQLIFREFYYHYYILNKNSYIISSTYRANILSKYDTYPWISDPKHQNFRAWAGAKTGAPLIDAAMNELATTFNMKNRMRMVVASFLTKDLNIDWRLGERHFAKLLVDYDPVVNNQSWQWAAGSGLDYRGSSRIFSVARQQQKYDPLGLYVNHFLPKNYRRLLNYNLKETMNNWKNRRKNWLNKLEL